ncbi:MAG: FAD-binding oxidoreductase [Paracoccaceae bacterium]
MASVDVTVRGAGIFGLSVAWACAQRGARVQVIDISGVGAGASGGVVGALSPHAPEAWNGLKAFQLDSLLMANGWWATVQAAGGADPGYARSGRLQPLADAAAVAAAQGRVAGAQTHWSQAAEWQVVQATGAEWEPASASGWLVRDTLSARISPRAALAALVAALRVRGAQIITGDAADAGAVVHATGAAGLQELSQALGRKVGGAVKGQAAVLAYEAGDAPQIFAPGLHIVPHADGTVAIGSTSETSWTTDGVDTQLEALIVRARALMPCLADAPVIQRWAGLRPRAVTRRLVLDHWPGRPGVFVANGGFKVGFGLAPRASEVMADLVLQGLDRVPDEFRL